MLGETEKVQTAQELKERIKNLYLEIFNTQTNIIESVKNVQFKMEEIFILTEELEEHVNNICVLT
ncbi:MAG: hypothetical protein FWE02_00520 [Defluviitaleaceae bacterium]|nr:hypothetical protein [Defluviitaleaceae bacterium]